MILDDVQSWSFFAKVLHDDATASADLSWFAFLVNFAETAPFAEFLAAVDTNQWNLMFGAQCLDELFVLWLITTFGENAENCLTSRRRKNLSLTSICLRFCSNRFQSSESHFHEFQTRSKSKGLQNFLFTLTCPTLCRLDEFHAPIRRKQATS